MGFTLRLPLRKQQSGKLPILALFLLLSLVTLLSLYAQETLLFNERLFSGVKQKYGEKALERVKKWQSVIIRNQGEEVEEQLYQVNRFFNRVRFIDDIKHWQKSDYWATPIEFLGTNGGDCEDFSIAKYFSLRALGVPTSKLRLMYVKALKYNLAHMVLAYYETPNSVPLVLDNLIPEILSANRRRDLQPVYSFNGDGLWLAREQGQGRQVQNGGTNRLWEDLNKRMMQELNNQKDN